MGAATVRAIEMAKQAGIDPKVFRSALRKAGLCWHGHYDRWEVPQGSVEHVKMQEVLDSLLQQRA
jgi:hypothetical protein